MTTKYLKITNKSGLVPRINLEKLGLSTKRNDPSTIGQFGSGIKFAPIAALRNGWEWWFTGQDSNGYYKMQYVTQIEDGVECIAYDYGDYRKSSSFTVDAGSLSWIDPFQIYREAVANAFDEASSSDDWSISIVDKEDIVCNDNEFSVYITAAPELMEIHNNFYKYFAIDREVVHESYILGDKIEFLPKADSSLRIYCHKVLVYHDNNFESVYDYNIDSASLNEERTLSSLYSVEWALSNTLIRLSDQSVCDKIIQYSINIEESPFELLRFNESVLNYHDANIAWANAYNDRYGEESVIYDSLGAKIGARESIQLRGYKPMYINDSKLYGILKSAGIKSYTEVLGADYHLNADYDISKFKNVNHAANIVSQFIPEIKELILAGKFGVFESEMENNLGLTLNVDKARSERSILINKNHANDSIENIIGTIVHEYDHYDTGFGDADYRHFRDVADKRIASLMMKFHVDNFFELRDDVLVLPMSKIASIGSAMTFQIDKTDYISIIRIGDKTLYANHDVEYRGDSGEFDPVVGILAINQQADGFVIPFLNNVRFVGVINV